MLTLFKKPAKARLSPKQKARYASNRRFTDDEVRYIRMMFQRGETKANLARALGIVPTAITRILTGESYSWVK